MRQLFIFVLVVLSTQHAFTQTINRELLEKRWKASWIAVPGEEPDRYGVYIFRKQITLDTKPSQFIIHVSADNRYKLYVNETMVSVGPARGDIEHWNFETVDISPYLMTGKNIIAAKVWNEASWRPEAQISIRTGFILQGNTGRESAINTDRSWRCTRDESYQPIRISMPSYYVTGPGELVHMNRQLRGWQKDDFNDSSWKNAVELFNGMPSGIRSLWNY